jgi:type I restriction enzyme R subunit
MEKEANARLKINQLLIDSGWRLLDSKDGKANVTVENHLIAASPADSGSMGNDFEQSSGFADYVLWGQHGKPVAVLEAKRSSIHPLSAKEQARSYAQNLGVQWVILSNGTEHFQWNVHEGNPEPITRFPSQDSLETYVRITRDVNDLVQTKVSADYIVQTQMPEYNSDPRWQTEVGRQEMMDVEGLRFLREYQLRAIQSLQQAIAAGKKRFLFEMATGTGKTLTSAAIIKLFIKTQNASRVLFLVDRLELENQTEKNFRTYLSPDITTYIFKDHKDDWSRAEVVVTTIQSIMNDQKFEQIFNPNDFDLIISDEAHRAISGLGASRDVFEYFKGYKLGLTATPKDYLKNLDQKSLSQKDPREVEQRILFSTYKTFGCESGEPTFRYSLLDGVKDGNLVNPYVLDCRTRVTSQLLSDDGYVVANNPDDEGDEERVFYARNFEKNFFTPDTNQQFVKLFMTKAMRDPLSDEIGKTLIFCVSQSHAQKITQLLNEYAHQAFLGMYNSDFAIQVTSNVRDAQSFTTRFASNNLNGETRMLPGYKSSKTRVCVTVGMMTTGYDCQDILNICLMRPIFSPQDFVQIKGRGTRTFTFNYSPIIDGQRVTKKAGKKTFHLFDFFANCEFFEEKYPYDEVLDLPKSKEQLMAIDHLLTEEISHDLVDFAADQSYGHTRKGNDLVSTVKEGQVSYDGMAIDSKLYGVLKDAARAQKEQETELMGKTHALWKQFVQQHEVPYQIMNHVRDILYLASLDQKFLSDLYTKDFSSYTDRPEVFEKLESIGRQWIDAISTFLLNPRK